MQPVPKAVYRSGFYEKPATAHGGFEPWSSHTAVRHVTAKLLRPAVKGQITDDDDDDDKYDDEWW